MLAQVAPEALSHRSFAKVAYRDHLPRSLLDTGVGGAKQALTEWFSVVSKGKVSVREAPDGDAEELGLLQPGNEVSVADKAGDW